MQHVREQANKRLKPRLVKREYKSGQRLLVWDYERMKQLDDKFKPSWQGPWRLDVPLTRTIWRAIDLRGRDSIVHTDALRPFHEE